jgi:hypothetical protein
VAASIEQLSFELTMNALSEQERALAGLRTCAGTVLAAACIAGSVLAATTNHGSPNAWVIVAVISLAFCSCSAIWVLLPHELVFALSGEALLAKGDGRAFDLKQAYRAATTWIDPLLHTNNSKITGLSSWLTASCASLTVEIILRTISLT